MRSLLSDERRRLLMGVFGSEDDVLGAVRLSRAHGHEIVDVYGPYPIHGIGEAIGMRASRMPFVCLAFGLAGLVTALVLQYWTSAVDWPINVGGKPFDSLPAFVPVAFELTVLFAGIGSFIVFLLRSSLRPGKPAAPHLESVTDDKFVVVLREAGSALDTAAVNELWGRHNVLKIEVGLEEGRS